MYEGFTVSGEVGNYFVVTLLLRQAFEYRATLLDLAVRAIIGLVSLARQLQATYQPRNSTTLILLKLHGLLRHTCKTFLLLDDRETTRIAKVCRQGCESCTCEPVATAIL